MKKVSKESEDLIAARIASLNHLFPEAFVEGKLDLTKLKELLGDVIETKGERYSFSWAGRSAAIKIRDHRSKETLTPIRRDSVNFDITSNQIIEGDNLEVLKILQKAYEGKVKMIYLDPPYNTGNDFVYKDDYSDGLKNYLVQTGQMTEEGVTLTTNTERSGRFHSTWITMMYPRLALARNFLSEEGLIFISIDDNEVQNLRIIMNEIFGEENFIAQLIWKRRQIVDSRPQNGVSIDHEYILVYSKNVNAQLRGKNIDKSKYLNPDNDSRGPWMSNSILGLATADQRPNLHYKIKDPNTGIEYDCPPATGWRYSVESMNQKIKEKRIVFPKKKDGRPREKKFLSELEKEFTGFSSVLSEDIGYTLNGTREVRDLFQANIFSFPKPVSLIKELIKQGTDGESIVLDFFAGAGTTAQASMELNYEDGGKRKFILIQLPEHTPKDSEAYKAGYKTIADICKERVRRAIQKIKTEMKKQKVENEGAQDLGFKVFELSKSNCFVWDEKLPKDQTTLAKHIESAAKGAISVKGKEYLVYEIMLREGFRLDSKIEQPKKGKNHFYKITDNGHEIWMCFDEHLDEHAVMELELHKDTKLVVFDSALTDSQKVNLGRKLRIETV